LKANRKPFRFKQFEIYQDQCAMKVGTDGVLLGAWTQTNKAQNILDIGCGTGLISLMLAQKTSALILALEIDKNAAKQADENFRNSPWKSQLKIENIDFQSFWKLETQTFDLIVCNPPFFNAKQSETSRQRARQNESLPFENLFEGVNKMLSKLGRFNLVVPIWEEDRIIELAKQNELFLYEILRVRGNPKNEIKRILLSFGSTSQKVKENELTIELARNQYTKAYQKLVKDYLIIFE